MVVENNSSRGEFHDPHADHGSVEWRHGNKLLQPAYGRTLTRLNGRLILSDERRCEPQNCERQHTRAMAADSKLTPGPQACFAALKRASRKISNTIPSTITEPTSGNAMTMFMPPYQ